MTLNLMGFYNFLKYAENKKITTFSFTSVKAVTGIETYKLSPRPKLNMQNE